MSLLEETKNPFKEVEGHKPTSPSILLDEQIKPFRVIEIERSEFSKIFDGKKSFENTAD